MKKLTPQQLKTIASASVATPATGEVTLFADTDNKIKQKDSTGTVTDLTATGSGGVSDGDKGDITVSGSGATWSVDASAITYAKIQNVNQQRLLGRSNNGTGVVTELQMGAGLGIGDGYVGFAPISTGRLWGNLSGASQVPYELNSTQVTAFLDNATTTTKGLVPAPGTSAGKYLKDDMTWGSPSGGVGSPTGNVNSVQFNNAGVFGGADKTSITASGSLNLAQDETPTTPAANNMTVFMREIANKAMLAQKDPSGLTTSLQPSLARNKVGYWCPPGNSTTVPGVFGFTAPTVVGTATARNVATTNGATRMRRLGYVSAATAGSLTEAHVAVAQFSCGSGNNDGSGFFYTTRFVPSNAAAVSGERFFVGMTSTTAAATNVEPSTLTNTVGLAQLSTDNTQFYIVYGGSTAQTAIACGTALGAPNTLSTAAYELAIFAPGGIANTYYIQVTNIFTGATFTTTLTGTAVQVPQSTTLLTHKAWKCNNATALAVGFDICSIYLETDS